MKRQPEIEDYDDFSLSAHLTRECKAMAQYALASGLKVPGVLLLPLEPNAALASGQSVADEPEENRLSGAAFTPEDSAPTTPCSSPLDLQTLAAIHGRLADIVAPARPRTLLLLAMEERKRGLLHFLGPVPLIRRMMAVACVCLGSMLLIGLSPYVNGTTKNFSTFENSGFPLLFNELFLLSAAGIGASFAALFLASRYIAEGTYDPIYESSYWSRFILGLMAGMIMAGLFPIESYMKAGGNGQVLQGFGKPLLALLGGFSAALVYRILNHFLTAIESLVRGDTHAVSVAREQAGKARYAEQAAGDRLQLMAKLNALQQQMLANPDSKAIARDLERLQQELAAPIPGIEGTAIEAMAIAQVRGEEIPKRDTPLNLHR